MRRFNTAGPCLPDKHYMLPPGRRLSEIHGLIDSEAYFVIHAPRQTGKTTLLKALALELNRAGKYSAIAHSLESLTRPEVEHGIPALLQGLHSAAPYQVAPECLPPEPAPFLSAPEIALRSWLRAWSEQSPRPLVLLLDEIDSIRDELLLSVLRQLREGYTARPAPFPHSLALVGLKDVRDYKIKVRKDSNSLGSASPFNIKSESLTLRNFTAEEMAELYGQHTEETGQAFEDEATASAFELTRGQPWLVNALARQCVEKLKRDGSAVTSGDVLEAKEILIERRDTHLDSLVDKLREERVRQVIEPILTGGAVGADVLDHDYTYVRDLGLITREHGHTEIANPIYREIIPRALTYVVQGNIPLEPAWYVADDGTLDMPKLIQGFLRFWRRNGEVLLAGMPYHEAAPHLVFMAYLQRIVNKGGRITREFAVGTGRADLVVEYGGREDVLELKLMRGKYTLADGLEQVAGYARKLGRDAGYLIIFDPASEAPFEDRGEVEQVAQDDVTVTVVRC